MLTMIIVTLSYMIVGAFVDRCGYDTGLWWAMWFGLAGMAFVIGRVALA